MISKIGEIDSSIKMDTAKRREASKKFHETKMDKINGSEKSDFSEAMNNNNSDRDSSLMSRYIADYYRLLPMRLKIKYSQKEDNK